MTTLNYKVCCAIAQLSTLRLSSLLLLSFCLLLSRIIILGQILRTLNLRIMNQKFRIFRIFLILDITNTFGPVLLYATCKYVYEYLLAEFRKLYSIDSVHIANKYKSKNILHE